MDTLGSHLNLLPQYLTIMHISYPIPLQSVRVYHEILRSKFVTSLGHASNTAAAQSFIQEIRAEFPDASHHCWAFNAGAPDFTGHIGCSDDGELRGTAGRPMLHALQHAEIGEIVGVVTRYFGGAKLGRGGLIRAYAGGIKAALAQLPLTAKTEMVELCLTLGYTHLARLEHDLPRFKGEISLREFGKEVFLRVNLPAVHTSEFQRFLQDLTAGQAAITGFSDESSL